MLTRACTTCCGPSASSSCPCQRTWYCSRECQKAHWKREHKKLCPGKPKKGVDPKFATALTKSEEQDVGVRVNALRKLAESPQLEQCVSIVLNRLLDPESDVRVLALKCMGNLAPATLDKYSVGVVRCLQDGYKDVRDAAMICLKRPVSYTHLRAHETPEHLVCRLLLEKKKTSKRSR
eukprot:TRINITY_DN20171_c0_g1_i5.p2 TRINITY_DN20171_c0_g1~~TRINITY_DN20171_c0_g1_i5.p2  ORF type:complete len:178 (-),score=46.00 TRINITY_DN20171_c0_g1_i5:5-538(-)